MNNKLPLEWDGRWSDDGEWRCHVYPLKNVDGSENHGTWMICIAHTTFYGVYPSEADAKLSAGAKLRGAIEIDGAVISAEALAEKILAEHGWEASESSRGVSDESIKAVADIIRPYLSRTQVPTKAETI